MSPTTVFDESDLEQGLDYLQEAVTQEGNLNTPSEVVLRVCRYHPAPVFQAVVRFRNSRLPWATCVHKDALTALTTALLTASQGNPEKDSTALYHRSQASAISVGEALLKEYEGVLVSFKVELVPSQGWVVVVFLPDGDPTEMDAELAEVAEVRVLCGKPGTQPLKPKGRGRKAAPPEPKASRSSGGHVPFMSRTPEPTKTALVEIYKGIHGKQPNNSIKKPDLAALLDAHFLGDQGNQGEEDEDLL